MKQKIKSFRPNLILKETEKAIDKKCETCQEYGACWATNSLREKACEYWKPDINVFQEKWEEIQDKMKE